MDKPKHFFYIFYFWLKKDNVGARIKDMIDHATVQHQMGAIFGP